MRTIYFDANILIHIVEGHVTQREGLEALVKALDERVVKGVTSELSIAEVMVKPLLSPAAVYKLEYDAILSGNASLHLVPVSREILMRSANLRGALGGKLADSIHAATAEQQGCARFMTEDIRLKLPPGLPRLRLAEFARYAATIREKSA